MKEEHRNFSCKNSGFLINPEYPLFGASPDGLSSCSCHGDGCLEVKCPHCLRTKGQEDILTSKSCLIEVGNSVCLDETHAYYFQVQMQLYVSGRSYCDLVLWTTRSIFVQRINPDIQFLLRHRRIAAEFSIRVLIPELLGKCFTEPSS